MTGAIPDLEAMHTTDASRILRRVMTAAWMAILAGLVLQGLILIAKLLAGGPMPGIKMAVDVASGITWALLVCAGVALGAAGANARSSLMGLLGFISAPLAFAGVKGVQKGVQAILDIPPDKITALVYMIAATKAVEYALLGIGLAWLLRRTKSTFAEFALLGLAVGVVFGGVIVALTIINVSPPTPAVVGLAVNEMVFPAFCASIIYLVGMIGRHADVLKPA